MKRFKTQVADNRDDNEINLTPMLDVVFIMLIFFIVTASFIRESGLDVNRSDAPPQVQPETKAILITIDDDDQIRIEGHAVDRRAVRAHIVRLHAENPDYPVVIEPGKSSTTRMLVAVLDAARAGKIDNISIAGK
jgi:biopolymer transport protein ExbD